jgi:glycosyl transferase family 61
MARKKPWILQHLHVRGIRYLASRVTVGAIPRAKRLFSFPTAVIRPWDCSSERICDETTVEAFPPLNREQEFILSEAARNDTGDTSCNKDHIVRVDTKIYALQDCSLVGHTGSIIHDKDARLVHTYRPYPTYYEARAKLLNIRRSGPERHIVLPPTVSHYHFFADAIVPLLSYLDRFHQNRAPLSVVMRRPVNAVQSQVLSAIQLEYPFLRVIYVGPDERLVGATLVTNFRLARNSEWMPVDPAIAGRLTAILSNYLGCSATRTSDRLTWFSRGSLKIRMIRNGTEIDAVCAGLGLDKYVADASDLLTQFQTFRDSKLIIGVHGAGLANIMFCRPGTTIVEIFPRNFIKSTYLWLSLRLNCKYIPYIGGNGDYWQRFTIDPSDFKQRLSQIVQ